MTKPVLAMHHRRMLSIQPLGLALATALVAAGCYSTSVPSSDERSEHEYHGDHHAASGGDISKCPVVGHGQPAESMLEEVSITGTPQTLDDWWPNRLDLTPLSRNESGSNPMGDGFDYAKEFATLDLAAVKKDIEKVLTTSQPWWPADYGHYGGLMIRLAWHSAGTYRTLDGRGGSASGSIRFAPLNSWPDNGNLDKARRLLWPIKQKYGRKLSWADLIILSGNVALESMGFKTFGFGGGREDIYEPEIVDWGPESEWLTSKRFTENRHLEHPLAASEMGLIYVNPEGPNRNPDPLAAAKDIRITFGRMAMNDEETVALIAGGHTLGKAHGAASPSGHVGPAPEGAPLEQQGFGWKNSYGSGRGGDTITSGLEGAWTYTPTEWSHDFFENLIDYEWKLVKSPAGAHQWTPEDGETDRTVPDAHDPAKRHAPMMLTTDLALKMDPEYAKISQRFYDDPDAFNDAFARAWFKLTHRDMGPHARLIGSEVPEPQLWQDPVPKVDHALISESDTAELKRRILASGLTVQQLVKAAWASASTYRDTDMRGGANGARIRLAPQKDWQVNLRDRISRVIDALERVRAQFNEEKADGTRVSLADIIVLGGAAAIEQAAKQAGYAVTVPFTPGRTDATQEMTDAGSFAVLEPVADGFRNYLGDGYDRPAPELMVAHAANLRLTAPEMTVLLGGLRVLGATHEGTKHGVLTERPGVLTNDFFRNLLDMDVVWSKAADQENVYEGRARDGGSMRWTGTSFDLVFGSNSQLRAIAEVYAADDAGQQFVDDFVASWHKVMCLDRFDLPQR